MRLIPTTLFALLLSATAFANPSLPEGVKELADLATPQEIWQELQATSPAPNLFEAEPTARLKKLDGRSFRLNIIVNKYTGSPQRQTLMVIEDGIPTYEWYVSTGLGKGKKIDTPPGTFTVDRMEYEWFSTVWDNAPMHRAIFFNGGIALHATYGSNIDRLGIRASGGCIRQHPDNAQLLWDLVKYYGPKETLIIVQE